MSSKHLPIISLQLCWALEGYRSIIYQVNQTPSKSGHYFQIISNS